MHLYLFLPQMPDGANAIVIGQMSETDEPLAYVGGNCAVLGFDAEGQDKYCQLFLLFQSEFTLQRPLYALLKPPRVL